MRLLRPGGGLADQDPGLTVFQVIQEKANSINMKPELQFGNRLVISACDHPGIISGKPELQSLKSHPWNGCAAWDPFPAGTPDAL